MHNKNACSPSSNGGGFRTATTAGSFASMYDYEKLPSLSGNSSGASLYPYTGSAAQYDSCFIQKQQDMVNRHNMCLTRLLETSKEVEALQQENGQLRAVNNELQKQLDQIVIQASLENRFGGVGGGCGGSAGQTPPSAAFEHLAHAFRSFQIGDGKENCADWNTNNINNMNDKEMQEVSDHASPTSVIESNNGNVEVERYSLPKSISVRSNGYLKLAQPVPPAATTNNACRPKNATRPRATSTPTDTVVRTHANSIPCSLFLIKIKILFIICFTIIVNC